VKIGPVDTEIALLLVKKKKLRKVKYIARSASLPSGLNEFLYTVYNLCYIRSRNPRVYTVNNSTFCGDTAKIGISCQISKNFLDLP